MSAADTQNTSASNNTADVSMEAARQSADSAIAGGDARHAAPTAPAAGSLPLTALLLAGDTEAAGVAKQGADAVPEAPCPTPATLPAVAVKPEKWEDGTASSPPPQRAGATPVVYVRVPVGERYPPQGYYRDDRGGWGGNAGGGGWGSSAGGGGGGGRGWPGLRDDADWDEAGLFSAAAVRRAFIRKVYAILSLQLALTVGIIALFIFEPNVKHFVMTRMEMYIAAFVTFFVTYLVLLCCGDVRRRYPWNLVLLFIFTLSFSYFLGVASAFHSTYIVFMAAAMTAVVTLLVTMVATFSKVDITGCGAMLCVLGLGVMLFSIVLMMVYLFWGPNNLLLAVYAGLVGVLFSLYLMFDTQLIMGGRYMELSPDEHIFATLMLYIDIANIFWALLTLFGYCCGD